MTVILSIWKLQFECPEKIETIETASRLWFN